MFKISLTRLSFSLVLLAFSLIIGVNIAMAQSAVTGAIGGSVSDPNNAAIPNAKVTLKSLDTNREESATTDAEGRYRFTNLQPGSYHLKISATGFAEYKQDRLVVEVGRTVNVDSTMKVGGTEATVEIVAAGGLVNVESKEFSSNINQT